MAAVVCDQEVEATYFSQVPLLLVAVFAYVARFKVTSGGSSLMLKALQHT